MTVCYLPHLPRPPASASATYWQGTSNFGPQQYRCLYAPNCTVPPNSLFTLDLLLFQFHTHSIFTITITMRVFNASYRQNQTGRHYNSSITYNFYNRWYKIFTASPSVLIRVVPFCLWILSLERLFPFLITLADSVISEKIWVWRHKQSAAIEVLKSDQQ